MSVVGEPHHDAITSRWPQGHPRQPLSSRILGDIGIPQPRHIERARGWVQQTHKVRLPPRNDGLDAPRGHGLTVLVAGSAAQEKGDDERLLGQQLALQIPVLALESGARSRQRPALLSFWLGAMCWGRLQVPVKLLAPQHPVVCMLHRARPCQCVLSSWSSIKSTWSRCPSASSRSRADASCGNTLWLRSRAPTHSTPAQSLKTSTRRIGGTLGAAGADRAYTCMCRDSQRVGLVCNEQAGPCVGAQRVRNEEGRQRDSSLERHLVNVSSRAAGSENNVPLLVLLALPTGS